MFIMSGIFSDSESRIYVALAGKGKDGGTVEKLKWKIKDGSKEFYNDTIGPVKITGVSFRESKDPNFKNRYEIIVSPAGGGKNVVVQLSEGSGYTNSVLNTLSTYPKGKLVKLRCSFGNNERDPKNPYYNVYVLDVAANDEWMKPPIPKNEIPEVKYVKVGDKEVGDDVARKQYFRKLAESINARLQAGNAVENAMAETPPLTQVVYDQTPKAPKKASFDDIPDSSGDDDLPF
jgi:hypothetical protein